ncbi:sideroflexin-3-like [Dromiciops gliroides]|uniref:sideroflexin-3-like n=1 Tax=Dromiciops gliroides TaxID=33562 RepID=UPI001CC4DA66|nr:sideroflexin-3-like [Dromiciops gliroides]
MSIIWPGQKTGELPLDINIRDPRWDQNTFVGRAKHFFTVTNPLNLLLSDQELHNARTIVKNYKAGIVPPGLTEDELWKAKTMASVVFWQWVNQSFNAIVNYSNRNGNIKATEKQLGVAYIGATTGAVVTALGLKSLTKHLPSLVGRFIPLTAVCAANCINIPLMREREILMGIPVTDDSGHKLGYSSKAAQKGIFQVVISRIAMAFPALTIPPIIMTVLEKKDFLKRRPWLSGPIQVGLVGFLLLFATPLCCAFFPQRSSMLVKYLEPELRAQIKEQSPNTEIVYFNKGL